MVYFKLLFWFLEEFWIDLAFEALDLKFVASAISGCSKDFEGVFVLRKEDEFTLGWKYLCCLF